MFFSISFVIPIILNIPRYSLTPEKPLFAILSYYNFVIFTVSLISFLYVMPFSPPSLPLIIFYLYRLLLITISFPWLRLPFHPCFSLSSLYPFLHTIPFLFCSVLVIPSSYENSLPFVPSPRPSSTLLCVPPFLFPSWHCRSWRVKVESGGAGAGRSPAPPPSGQDHRQRCNTSLCCRCCASVCVQLRVSRWPPQERTFSMLVPPLYNRAMCAHLCCLACNTKVKEEILCS